MEAQLVLFDYNALDIDTRSFVEARTGEIKALVKRSAQDIIEIGQKLTEVKARLGHGNFGQWLKSEFEWSQDTAQRFINVANKFQIPQIADFDFAPSALYLLAAPSTPDEAVDEAVERAENGERITYSLAKEIADMYKAVPADDPAPRITNDLGSYRQLPHAAKQCERCNNIWTADLDFCPYCHIKPEVRVHYAQQEEKFYRPAAANHALSDDPDYDGDEWYTPAEYIEAARTVLGEIDLDPASCEAANQTVRAGRYLTKADDALTQTWHGRVWLNPPYSTPLIKHFVSKLIDQYESGSVTEAIILTNNSSDTGWFHDLLSRYPACFTRGRAQFWRPDSSTFGARQGQTLFYLGDDFEAFRFVFNKIGQVVIRA